MRDALDLKQEFAAAEEGLEFTPVQEEADPVTENLVKQYNVADAKIAELREKYTGLTIAGVEDKKGYELVHAGRMEVREMRLAVEKRRVALKADALEYGRKVDKVAKDLTGRLSPIEDALEAEEKRIDAEREKIKAEAQRKKDAELQARVDALAKYGSPINLGEIVAMSQIQFEFALEHAKEAFEAKEKLRIAAEEALAKQEAERQEAERKAAAEKAEADRIERERMAKVAAEQAEMSRKLAEQKAELDRQAAAIKAKEEAAERAAREKEIAEKAAAQAKAKAEQDAKDAAARAEKEAAEAEARRKAAEAAKPDAEKIMALAKIIREIGLPKLTTDAGKAAMAEIETSIGKFATFLEGKAKALSPITNPVAP